MNEFSTKKLKKISYSRSLETQVPTSPNPSYFPSFYLFKQKKNGSVKVSCQNSSHDSQIPRIPKKSKLSSIIWFFLGNVFFNFVKFEMQNIEAWTPEPEGIPRKIYYAIWGCPLMMLLMKIISKNHWSIFPA